MRFPNSRRHRAWQLAAGAALAAIALSGCATQADSLAAQFRSGDSKNYIAGDGTVTEITAADRGDPVEFAGALESGERISSADYRGRVLVVNFWYAGCAPCRAEAPDLRAMAEKYQGQDVAFLGVNVRDQAATSLAFSETYQIPYPSVLDVNSGELQLAFSGTVAPNAVPTTLVIDKQGRVASRVLGRITDAGILDELIATALAEEN